MRVTSYLKELPMFWDGFTLSAPEDELGYLTIHIERLADKK